MSCRLASIGRSRQCEHRRVIVNITEEFRLDQPDVLYRLERRAVFTTNDGNAWGPSWWVCCMLWG